MVLNLLHGIEIMFVMGTKVVRSEVPIEHSPVPQIFIFIFRFIFFRHTHSCIVKYIRRKLDSDIRITVFPIQ